MEKEEVKITFETITPIWTGDVNQECTELKPASIIGSLRFWFEIYCHFAGIEVKENESLDYKKFLEKRKKDINKSEYEILKELGISLPSIIFGCTGWKSRIEIKEITVIKNYKYIYPIGKISLKELKYKKKDKIIIPSWYFKKCFFGKFSIIFKVSNNIKENILFPLLNFIEKYAFFGAKNNIGYGRVKILTPNINKNEIDFNFLGINKKITNEIFSEKNLPNNLNRLNYNEIEIFDVIENFNDIKSCIEKLLLEKAKLRRLEKDVNIRHYKFGSIAKDIYKNKKYNIEIKGPNATKIIPLISFDKSNNTYNCQLLSIWGIQNIGAKNE